MSLCNRFLITLPSELDILKDRMSIVTSDDIKAMYTNQSHEITLWCDARVEDAARGESALGKRRDERESEVEEVYMELKEKHKEQYETPKIRLWARMICSNIHSSKDEPPNIPAFNAVPKRKCTSSRGVSEAFSGAAVAFAQVLSGKSAPTEKVWKCHLERLLKLG